MPTESYRPLAALPLLNPHTPPTIRRNQPRTIPFQPPVQLTFGRRSPPKMPEAPRAARMSRQTQKPVPTIRVSVPAGLGKPGTSKQAEGLKVELAKRDEHVRWLEQEVERMKWNSRVDDSVESFREDKDQSLWKPRTMKTPKGEEKASKNTGGDGDTGKRERSPVYKQGNSEKRAVKTQNIEENDEGESDKIRSEQRVRRRDFINRGEDTIKKEDDKIKRQEELLRLRNELMYKDLLLRELQESSRRQKSVLQAHLQLSVEQSARLAKQTREIVGGFMQEITYLWREVGMWRQRCGKQEIQLSRLEEHSSAPPEGNSKIRQLLRERRQGLTPQRSDI